MNELIPLVFTVNFGPSKTGLNTIGYRLRGGSRVTAGVGEVVAGTGIYSVTISPPITPGYILWDTGDSSPHYWVEEMNVPMAPTFYKAVNFGTGRSGLATVGVVIQGVRMPLVEILAGTGIYGGEVTPPAGYIGPLVWDTGQGPGSILYGSCAVNRRYAMIPCFRTSSYAIRKISPSLDVIELRD